MKATSNHLLKTPLYEFHIRHHAKMVPFAGYDMPLRYEQGTLWEHRQVREHAGLFDVSHMGVIFIKCHDATSRLERVIPSDLKEMQLGEMKYTILLNEAGGIVDDLLITCLEDKFVLVVNAARKHEVLIFLNEHVGGASLQSDRAILAVQGPEAVDVVRRHYPSLHSLPFMHAYDGEPNLIISRCGYTGEDGFEFICPEGDAESLANKLLSHSSLAPIGLGARDSLRLEAGLNLYGHDINEDTSPVEASIAWVIGKRRRNEASFFGASRILRELTNGADKKRIGFVLDVDKAVAREGDLITDEDGLEIGYVTSGTFSPVLNKPIAMGYVNPQYLRIGTKIQVKIRDQLRAANVVKMPFVTCHYFKG